MQYDRGRDLIVVCCREENLGQVGYCNALSLLTLKIISNTNQNTTPPTKSVPSPQGWAVCGEEDGSTGWEPACVFLICTVCLFIVAILCVSHPPSADRKHKADINICHFPDLDRREIILTWLNVNMACKQAPLDWPDNSFSCWFKWKINEFK